MLIIVATMLLARKGKLKEELEILLKRKNFSVEYMAYV